MVFRKRSSVFKSFFLLLAIGFICLTLSVQGDTSSENQTNLTAKSIENLSCTDDNCFFPNKQIGDEDIHVTEQVVWGSDKNLVLHTKGNIVFEKEAKITSQKNGSIILKAGMEPDDNDLEKQKKNTRGYSSTIIFKGSGNQIILLGDENSGSHVELYYNPKGDSRKKHKYHNPTVFEDHIFPFQKTKQYMLVNDVYDLQGITALPHGNFALSQDIDASPTKEWRDEDGEPRGFYPIMGALNTDKRPFSGTFEGNNYVIHGLFINRQNEKNVGLFGDVVGMNTYKSTIKNFKIIDSNIIGKRCVGSVVGQAKGIMLANIMAPKKRNAILSDDRSEKNTVGVVGGCVFHNTHINVTIDENGSAVNSNEDMFGSCVDCDDADGEGVSEEN